MPSLDGFEPLGEVALGSRVEWRLSWEVKLQEIEIVCLDKCKFVCWTLPRVELEDLAPLHWGGHPHHQVGEGGHLMMMMMRMTMIMIMMIRR